MNIRYLVWSNSRSLSLCCCALLRLCEAPLPCIWSNGLPIPHYIKHWSGMQTLYCLVWHSTGCLMGYLSVQRANTWFLARLTSMPCIFRNCSLSLLAFLESFSIQVSSSAVHTTAPQNRHGPDPSYAHQDHQNSTIITLEILPKVTPN